MAGWIWPEGYSLQPPQTEYHHTLPRKETIDQMSNRNLSSEPLAGTELEPTTMQLNCFITYPYRKDSMKSSYSHLQTETISAFSTLPQHTRATEN